MLRNSFVKIYGIDSDTISFYESKKKKKNQKKEKSKEFGPQIIVLM